MGPTRISSGHRGLLQSRCQVHSLAGGERGLRILDDELAGLDPDACLEAEVEHRLTHRESCARRALCVVLVCLRNAERGQHGVSRELLDDPAVLGNILRDGFEELVQNAGAADIPRTRAYQLDDCSARS